MKLAECVSTIFFLTLHRQANPANLLHLSWNLENSPTTAKPSSLLLDLGMMPIPATWMKSEVDEQTLHGSELRKTTRDGPKTPVNNGINYQPQMVREIYEPTTVVGEI